MKKTKNNLKLNESLWLLAIGILCAFICHLIYTRIGGDLIKVIPVWHQENLSGKTAAPLQYRVLSFYLPEIYSKIMNVGIADAYLAIRMICLALGFWFVGLTVRVLTSEPIGPTLILVSVAIYYAASTQAHLQPAEEPNLLFFAALTWLVARGSGIVNIAIIFALGAFNKDTVGFLIPFVVLHRWICQQSLSKAIRDGVILSIIFIAIYVGLRIHYGIDREYLGGVWQAGKNLNFIIRYPARGLMWTIPSIIPLLYLLINWKVVPTIVKCYIPTMILFVVGHFMISITDEFRTYTPLALVMWTGVLMVVVSTKVAQDTKY